MGMPTITSNTFAYSEVENSFDFKFTFKNINDFEKSNKFLYGKN